MSLNEAAKILGATHHGPNANYSSVCHDSRFVKPGSLYVALRGDRLDGHEFIADAKSKGAVGVLADHLVGYDLPSLVVPDTLLGLQLLASEWRSRFHCPLVGITGSNGKTTVKEMIGAILSLAGQALVTRGNYNNHVGLPLTLLELKPEHDYAVVEMGMNHSGELSNLTALARPAIAVINNAAAAHLEGLGSVKNVARAKAEILEGLSSDGIAIINGDDDYCDLWQELASPHQVVKFGFSENCDVKGSLVSDSPDVLSVTHSKGRFAVTLQVPGQHNMCNALAAIAVALQLNIDERDICNGLASFVGVKGRLQLLKHHSGSVIINDSYNANPASLEAALKVLAEQSGKRILVLGEMGELGGNSQTLHTNAGRMALDQGIDSLLAIGDLSQYAAEAFGDGAMHFDTIDSLMSDLCRQLGHDVAILIKGSRAMQMERLVDRLMSESTGETS